MIDPEMRARFVRTIRSMSTEERAVRMAEAYESELRERDDVELTELEQLPAWTFPELLKWALSKPVPPQIEDAKSVLIMREFRLLGDLARAAEQAMLKGEVRHAQRIARVLAMCQMKVRGEELLALALELDEGEGLGVEA